MNTCPDPFLSEREVIAMLGVARSTLRRWMADGTFPRPIKLSAGPRGRVAWRQSTIEHWVASRSEAATSDVA